MNQERWLMAKPFPVQHARPYEVPHFRAQDHSCRGNRGAHETDSKLLR